MLKASPPAEPLVDWRSEISAGLISSLVCLPLCLACGLLVFAPLGPDYVATGAAAGLYGGAIVGLVAAVVATSSYIVTTSRVSMALVQAGLTTTLVNDATLASQPAMIVTAIMLCLFLAGLWQVLFGLLGLTRAIKFAPHPVLTGLLNGVGMLIVISQFKPFFAAQTLWPNKPAMLVYVVALALFVLNYPAIAGWLRLPDWLRKIPGSLAGFVAGTALYYLISVPTGLDLGPTIGEIHVSFPPAMPLGAVFDGSITPELTAVLPHVVLVSLVLAIIGTVETMLAFRVAQQLDDTHIHPVRDLAAQGIANAAAALGGGIGGSAIPSVILLGYRMGGRTRWTSIFVALSLLAITFALSSVLAQVPRAVFAGLLLVIGIVLFDRWNLQLLADIRYSIEPQVRRHAVYNLIVVLAVMAVTVFSSVVSGVIVGIILSCIIFVINMSRPLVRRAHHGDTLFSKRIRSADDLAILQQTGQQRAILQLEGALFFGNADDLSLRVKDLFNSTDMILLDMGAISDLDVSGVNALRTLRQKAAEKKRRLIYCNVRPVHAAIIGNGIGHDPASPSMTQDLDSALEWMEQTMLDRSATRQGQADELTLEQIDFLDGVSANEMAELTAVMTRREFACGDTICREGGAGDRMWLILKGSVSVLLRTDGHHERRRIAGLGRGTTVGEMALVESVPRSATIVADDEVVCYEFPRDGFDLILKKNPVLATRLLGNLARELTRRLRQTSQDLRASHH
ncbi:SLC26A/SulP transporter family protein [Tardiphaga sp. 841_E9_N1_2]|uniref:SLC26A/SulP transporter family protein n=1 Tax=Tardiphaga sp. 841_E9_N1_2 TaxID=3240762 RepID=UPI003F243F13